jgi:hypothetical protein
MPNGPGPEARDGDALECWSAIAALAASVPRVFGATGALRRDRPRPRRDPVSTQALLFLSTDKEWLTDKRPTSPWPPRIVGTPGEVADIVARYREAGADELIIPDFTLGPVARAKDTCDLFMQEVAPSFR